MAEEFAADQLRALADGFVDTLRTAEALVRSNRRVDLEGLDREVNTLCARVLDLSRPHRGALRPLLHDLVTRADLLLDALAAAAPAAATRTAHQPQDR